MTEISFHINPPDPGAYPCRLLRKAVASGARLVVTGQAEQLAVLDEALWTFSPMDFIPHCFTRGDALVLEASPVVLADLSGAPISGLPHHQVLVNLGDQVPTGFESFERLIEIVGGSESELQAARRRWRHYADRGYAPVRHQLA